MSWKFFTNAGLEKTGTLGGFSTGTLALRPAAATAGAGAQYFATDDWGGTLHRSDGAAWSILSSKNQQITDVSAAASVTFSSLDGNTDLIYTIQYAVDTSVAAGLIWQGNADTTAANYVTNYNDVTAGAAADSTGSNDFVWIHASAAALRILGTFTIYAKTGTNRVFDNTYSAMGTSAINGKSAGRWTDTTNNITSLLIKPASGTFTGRFILHRGSVG